MDDNSQNNNDFPDGFLIKDKSGQLKKVQDGKVVDFKPSPPASQPKVAALSKNEEDEVSAASLSAKPKEEIVAPDQTVKSKPATWPLSPQTPISSSLKAAYIIESEDEEEIKKHEEKLKKIVTAPHLDLLTAMSTVIDKVIHQHNLYFEDEIMQKRFSKVVESRLKNIRDSIETEEVLTRAKKVGGLELAPELVKNIVRTVEVEAGKLPEFKLREEPLLEEKKVTPDLKDITSETEQKIGEPDSLLASPPPSFVPRPKVSVEKEVGLAPSEKAVVKEEVAGPEEGVIIEEKIIEEQKPIPSVEQAVKPVPPAESKKVSPIEPTPSVSPPVSIPFAAQPVEELYQRSPEDEMAKIAKIRKPISLQRPQVIDIKQPATVVGPIEELGGIDLKEFRRLGTSPGSAAEKILEKIYLLEEESWQMKMDGLKAWQRSPVYQLYLEMGRKSIESGKTVEEVIQTQIEEDKPRLIMEEFLAINDLNSKLII